MGKKDHEERKEGATEAVIQYLKKQAPLTVKQEKFCSNACVERFLKVRDYNVKKAAKSLRSCLSWRESIGTDHLIADEFSAELAEGVAYVAGHDEESRPVLIFRIKQDYQKFHSQKLFTRLLVFTLEVAIGTMAKSVQQLVLLFDASLFRSASAFINLLLAALKILGEYYPGRLHRAFVIDAPTLFSYLWKGVRSFVELSSVTTVLSSLEFEDSFDTDDFASSHGAASLRFHPSSVQHATKPGSSSSSRFSFTVSHHLDSLKPWYLSLTNTSSSKVGPTSPSPSLLGPARISPLNARSISFASPAARMPRGSINEHHAYSRPTRKTLFPSTPLPQKTGGHFWTPRPSFLQSPAAFFKRDCYVPRAEKSRELFASYLKFYRRPYDEMAYRSKMRPPLGRLVSVVHPQFKRRHVSMSQRF